MLDTANIVAFLPTLDFDRSCPFFADTLGLPLVAEDPYALTFNANGTTLRVTLVESLEAHPFTVLGWWVDDVPATVDQLVDRGVTFERYPTMEQDERGLWMPPGSRVQVAWFKDPDGNTLSITGFASP